MQLYYQTKLYKGNSRSALSVINLSKYVKYNIDL